MDLKECKQLLKEGKEVHFDKELLDEVMDKEWMHMILHGTLTTGEDASEFIQKIGLKSSEKRQAPNNYIDSLWDKAFSQYK